MKKILAYFILSIFTLISLQQVVLLGAFFLNQDYIIDKFCINKNEPELKCNGKCHLKDVMSKTSEQTEESRTSIVSSIIFPVFYSEFNLNISIDYFEIRTYLIFDDNYFSKYTSKTFHPPQFFYDLA